jgi:hypothetical protein
MTITLRPDQERVLIDAISSGLANTPDEALDQALETLRRRLPDPRATSGESGAERARAFERWGNDHPKRPPLPETAFRRESAIRDGA